MAVACAMHPASDARHIINSPCWATCAGVVQGEPEGPSHTTREDASGLQDVAAVARARVPATYRSGCPKVARQTFVAATATSLVGAAADGVPAHTAYWSTNGAASSNGSQTAVTQMQRRRTTASVD